MDNGNSTATLAGSPAAGTAGDYSLTITAANGVLPDAQQSFTLTVHTPAQVTSPNTIANNSFTGTATGDTVEVNGGATGTLALTIGPNTWSGVHAANGIDVHTTVAGGTINLALTGNASIATASGSAILVDGSGGGALTITALSGLNVPGTHGGTGLSVTNATFDQTPGGTFQTVTAGAAAIGASGAGNGVGTSGMLLSNVSGDLSFTDLDIFADNGTALSVTGTAAYTGSAGIQVAVTNTGVATLSATGGPAASLSTVTANLQLQTLSSANSASTGVSLTSVLGTFTSAGSITNATGTDFAISGGTATVTYSGTITDDVGQLVNVSGATGGVKTFSGAISDGNDGDGSGISLTGNGGATIAFSGGLTLSTGANPAFTATGGGTVTATQNNTSIVNTLTTTTVTALNVASTAIGSAGLTFRSITAGTAAGSAGDGIIVDNTGVSAGDGGLTVTGNGSAGSGGTIQHKTGADGSTTSGIGIYLNNTKNPSLSWMQLNDFDNSAIVGRGVQGFTLQDSVINGVIGTSSGPVEGPINFGLSNPGGTNGLQGIGLIRNTKISGGVEHNVEFYNQSGNMVLTIDGTTAVNAGNPTDPADDTAGCVIEENSTALGSDGILMEMQDSATATITVDSCLFRDNKSQAMQLNALQNSAVTVTLQNSRATRNNGAGGQGNEAFLFSNSTNADLTVTVDNNDVFGILGANIFVGQVAGNATSSSNLVARVTNNRMTVGAVGGPYPSNRTLIAFLTSTVGQASTANLLVSGNTINTQSDPVNGLAEALFVSTPDVNTGPSFTARVLNNTVNINDPGATSLRGIAVQSTQGNGAVNANGCFIISGNDVNHIPAAPAGVNGLRLRQASNGVARLEGTGAPDAFLASANPLSTTEVVGTISVVASGTCLAQPPP